MLDGEKAAGQQPQADHKEYAENQAYGFHLDAPMSPSSIGNA
jgi:hypothetical protein